MTTAQERERELTKNMLRKKLHVVLSSGKKGGDLMPVLTAHLQYVVDLEKQGGCCSRPVRSMAAQRATA